MGISIYHIPVLRIHHIERDIDAKPEQVRPEGARIFRNPERRRRRCRLPRP